MIKNLTILLNLVVLGFISYIIVEEGVPDPDDLIVFIAFISLIVTPLLSIFVIGFLKDEEDIFSL